MKRVRLIVPVERDAVVSADGRECVRGQCRNHLVTEFGEFCFLTRDLIKLHGLQRTSLCLSCEQPSAEAHQ